MAKGSVNISGASDEDIDRRIALHDEASDSHADIRILLTKLRADLDALALKTATNITKNAFTVTFENLDKTAVTGVWDEPLARIEF